MSTTTNVPQSRYGILRIMRVYRILRTMAEGYSYVGGKVGRRARHRIFIKIEPSSLKIRAKQLRQRMQPRLVNFSQYDKIRATVRLCDCIEE